MELIATSPMHLDRVRSFLSGRVGNKFGSGSVLKEGGDGFFQESKHVAADLCAGGDRCPNAFEPALAGVAARTLSDLSVDDHEADGLFGEIVGWFEAGSGDEAEVAGAVLVKAFGEVLGFFGAGHAIDNFGPELITSILQSGDEAFFCIVVACVDDGEKGAQSVENTLAVGLVFGVRMFDEEADIAKKMSEAELNEDARVFHEFAVGGEVITADEAVEVVAEHFEEDIGAARMVDLKEREESGAEAPSPHARFVIFVSRFIDVETRLLEQAFGEVIVSVGHAVADFGNDFGEIAATDFDAEEIAKEAFDGGVRAVTGALEIADQSGEPWSCKPGLCRRLVKGRVMDLFAFAAPARMRADTRNRDHLGRQRQFDLLNDFGRLLATSDRAVTIGAFGAEDIGVSDIGIFEGIAPMGIVSGLSAAFAFGVVVLRLGFWLGLITEIAGRRLGRIAGILFQRRDLGLELRDLRSLLLDQTQQSVASCTRGHPSRHHVGRVYSAAAIRTSEFKTA